MIEDQDKSSTSKKNKGSGLFGGKTRAEKKAEEEAKRLAELRALINQQVSQQLPQQVSSAVGEKFPSAFEAQLLSRGTQISEELEKLAQDASENLRISFEETERRIVETASNLQFKERSLQSQLDDSQSLKSRIKSLESEIAAGQDQLRMAFTDAEAGLISESKLALEKLHAQNSQTLERVKTPLQSQLEQAQKVYKVAIGNAETATKAAQKIKGDSLSTTILASFLTVAASVGVSYFLFGGDSKEPKEVQQRIAAIERKAEDNNAAIKSYESSNLERASELRDASQSITAIERKVDDNGLAIKEYESSNLKIAAELKEDLKNLDEIISEIAKDMDLHETDVRTRLTKVDDESAELKADLKNLDEITSKIAKNMDLYETDVKSRLAKVDDESAELKEDLKNLDEITSKIAKNMGLHENDVKTRLAKLENAFGKGDRVAETLLIERVAAYTNVEQEFFKRTMEKGYLTVEFAESFPVEGRKEVVYKSFAKWFSEDTKVRTEIVAGKNFREVLSDVLGKFVESSLELYTGVNTTSFMIASKEFLEDSLKAEQIYKKKIEDFFKENDLVVDPSEDPEKAIFDAVRQNILDERTIKLIELNPELDLDDLTYRFIDEMKQKGYIPQDYESTFANKRFKLSSFKTK